MKSQANREAAIPRYRLLLSIFAAFSMLRSLACTAWGQDFVPFVIPAKVNPEQAIWVTDYRPIKTDSERLTSRTEHFYDSGGACGSGA